VLDCPAQEPVTLQGGVQSFDSNKSAGNTNDEENSFDDNNGDDAAMQEAILETQTWATDTVFTESKSSYGWIVRRTARQLAAAYYISTYSPFRIFPDEFALFSFPWLVADVIACCVSEKEKELRNDEL
jgi:hypothetical protein